MTSTGVLAILGGVVAGVVALGCNDSVTPPPPQLTITAVSPAAAPPAGGTSVTITGTNFIDVISVTIGGRELGARTVVSTSQITGTTPAPMSPGPKDVVVTSTSHGNGACSDCLIYLQPLAVGPYHTCGLGNTGQAYCWGDNSQGELGDGSTMSSLTPVAVAGSLDLVALSGSGYQSLPLFGCALTRAGTAYCWGGNSWGQLGDGSTAGSSRPVPVAGDLQFGTIGTGSAHTCALTRAGAAYCWGTNNAGQLGNGTTTDASSGPVAVSGALSFSALAVGYSHTCALTGAGVAYCWGEIDGPDTCPGARGGTYPCSTTPVSVETAFRWVSITAGEGHTCALTQTGAAYCWGSNLNGQLGNGSPGSSSLPVAVAAGLTFTVLAAGIQHTCGLIASGAAYCWGANYFGQLGDGSNVNRSTPVPVYGGVSFSALAAGWGHTCGRTSAGAVYCWGDNHAGQLGDGSTTPSLIPVAVSGWP